MSVHRPTPSSPITVVGGVYRESCLRPRWFETYGSAGRAASVLRSMGAQVEVHSYLDAEARESLEAHAAIEGFSVVSTPIKRSISFEYQHGLDTPRIYGREPVRQQLCVSAEQIVRFGLLEGDAVVHGGQVVYDPQDPLAPKPFHSNGSTARRLALILNRGEAGLLTGMIDAMPEQLAEALLKSQRAEVVLIKQGPLGVLVHDGCKAHWISAYKSQTVWKIGSGDNFVAHFAFRWILEGRTAVESADLASRATAYYCQTRGFATADTLAAFRPEPITLSDAFRSNWQPLVYLAGPFFSLGQLWIVNQARTDLRSMGLKVFSPYHDVGLGSAQDVVKHDLAAIEDADIIFAIGDGMDPGTIYEVGYGRAKGKPVVLYCENESEENLKMMQGSDCVLCDDYVSAIYRTLWTACAL